MTKWMKLFSFSLLAVGAMVLFAPRSVYGSQSSCSANRCQGYQWECVYGTTSACYSWIQVTAGGSCGWDNPSATCYCTLPSGDGYNGTWVLTSNPCPNESGS